MLYWQPLVFEIAFLFFKYFGEDRQYHNETALYRYGCKCKLQWRPCCTTVQQNMILQLDGRKVQMMTLLSNISLHYIYIFLLNKQEK